VVFLLPHGRYINGLAQAIGKHGGQIFEQTSAFKCEGNQVTTIDGKTVTAGAVVMATNSPLNHNLAVHARQQAQHTYCIGLKIPKGSIP
jgi:glycine/D-amino acid oxidase-like deaminating enzyme